MNNEQLNTLAHRTAIQLNHVPALTVKSEFDMILDALRQVRDSTRASALEEAALAICSCKEFRNPENDPDLYQTCCVNAAAIRQLAKRGETKSA